MLLAVQKGVVCGFGVSGERRAELHKAAVQGRSAEPPGGTFPTRQL